MKAMKAATWMMIFLAAITFLSAGCASVNQSTANNLPSRQGQPEITRNNATSADADDPLWQIFGWFVVAGGTALESR